MGAVAVNALDESAVAANAVNKVAGAVCACV